MTALEGELDACGGADAPPSAAARLREVLTESLKHGRTELAKPRSGLEHPVEIALAAQHGALLAATPADAALRADPEAIPEREWLLVAAVVGTLVELAEPERPTGPDDLQLTRGRAPRRLPRPRLSRTRELDAELVDARLRGARRTASTACAARALALPPGVIDDVALKTADRRPAPAAGSPRPSPASAASPPAPTTTSRTRCSPSSAPAARAPARTRTPIPPSEPHAASSSGSTAWASGADITPSSPISREASPATTARSPRRWGRPCWRRACWPRSRPSASATSTSTRARPPRSAS